MRIWGLPIPANTAAKGNLIRQAAGVSINHTGVSFSITLGRKGGSSPQGKGENQNPFYQNSFVAGKLNGF